MKKLSSLPTLPLLLIFLLSLAPTGCLLDFDDFSAAPDAGSLLDNQGQDSEGDDADDADAADTDDEMGAPGTVGALCEDDDDCHDSGVCMGSVCLTSCDDDHDCPSYAGCFEIGTDKLCAPRCQDTNTCTHYEEREDLRCVYLVQTKEFGPSPHSLERACLTDEDDDGVFDGIDNCPDDVNPTQRDSSGDGIGDACADDALCHQLATDGVLDYDFADLRPGTFTIPHTVQGRWLPVLGINDDQGSPESTLLLLDRVTGQWKDKGFLRYGGTDRHMVSTNRGGYLITPGFLDGADSPLGAWAQIGPTAEISYPAPFISIEESSDLQALARFSNGAMHQFDLRWELETIEGDNGDDDESFWKVSAILTEIDDSLRENRTLTVNLFTAPDSESPQEWRAQQITHLDGSQTVAIWRPDARMIELFDISAPIDAPGVLRINTSIPLPASWTNEGESNEEELQDFDPIFVPAPGGQLYLFDKDSGRAGRLISTREEPAIARRVWGDFERTPEYDLNHFADFDDLQFYTLPDAVGLGLVGRPKGDPKTIQVRELFFACLPQTSLLDTDGDGHGDFIDNCPLDENPGQEDLDQDSWGDACDPDIDGDRIPNSEDFILVDPENADDDDPPGQTQLPKKDTRRDSTNDGIDNDDSHDVDGDGIPNRYDPFPLDSSNSGTPNRWTSDSSGNGIPDEALQLYGYNPYNFFSIPSSQRFAYILEADDGGRTLFVGDLSAPSQAEHIELPDHIHPHDLSFGPDGSFLTFLGGPPGETQYFYVYHLDLEDEADKDDEDDEGVQDDGTDKGNAIERNNGTGEDEDNQDDGNNEDENEVQDESISPLEEYDAHTDLRSISAVDESTFIAVRRQDGEQDKWAVSLITAQASEPLEVFTRLPHIWAASMTGPQALMILAADTDCRDCALIYHYKVTQGDLETPETFTLETTLESTKGVQYMTASDGYAAILYDSDLAGEDPVAISYGRGAQNERSRALIPAQFDAVTSLSFSRIYTPLGVPFTDSVPFLMATMSRWGQSPNLWISFPTTDSQWFLFLALPEAIVEGAWAP